jgi:hypothetical protein
MSANDKQVGGEHYKGTEHQHWDVVKDREWCYLVGAATKYLWRLGRKGDENKKIEDIQKAIHCLEKKLEQLRDESDDVAREEAARQMAINFLDSGSPTSAYVNQD